MSDALTSKPPLRVLALAGGVGGANLAAGLSHVLKDRLTVLVNTGDDFEHVGLHVSPDVDTVMYTLGGIANPQAGWGIAGETWEFFAQLQTLGGPGWFMLGDRDLATHVLRTDRLGGGETLTTITADLCKALGIRSSVLPMTDDRVRTRVHSGDRSLDFQHYFVREKCGVPVTRLTFDGVEKVRFNAALHELEQADGPLAVIICPSNPYLSIDPILLLPGLRDWLMRVPAVRLAVSTIVGGQAIKGPAAKIMQELGIDASVQSVAKHYSGLVDGFVFDRVDKDLAGPIAALKMHVLATQTIMRDADDAWRWRRIALLSPNGCWREWGPEGMDIIVPCKGLSTGKSRLRECLGSHNRRELCEWLLVSTLRAAGRLVGARRVHVVTLDAEADAIARGHGIRRILDPGLGLNEELEVARTTLLAEGRSSMMVLPIDLPYADAPALANVAACAGDMVIVSDERGSETNILFMRDAVARRVPFAFGDGSFAAHLASARRLGLSSRIFSDRRLVFDIDEPVQYFQWREACERVAETTRDRLGDPQSKSSVVCVSH